MPSVVVSRRRFVAGALAVAAGSIGAACSRSAGRDRAKAAPEHVVVSNHPLYIDATTNAAFTAATGIDVEYHEDIGDDDAWFASVAPILARGDVIDRDVVIVADWIAARLRDRGWTTGADPVTWASSMVGIAFDSDQVPGGVARVADLFTARLHGRVALPTDMRLALGMALLADGVDPATVTRDQATATATRLANSVRVGQVLPLDGTAPLAHLASGAAVAAVVRASDVVRTRFDFVVPAEGGLLLTDVAVALGRPGARDGTRTPASSYLEFVGDPAHAVERFRALPVLWDAPGPVDDAMRRAAPATNTVVADPRRNPPADVRARLHRFRVLDDADAVAFASRFDDVVHAAGR